MKIFLKKGTKLKKYKLTKRESNSKLSPSFLFMVFGTSEGSEWYQIDPKWVRSVRVPFYAVILHTYYVIPTHY